MSAAILLAFTEGYAGSDREQTSEHYRSQLLPHTRGAEQDPQAGRAPVPQDLLH